MNWRGASVVALVASSTRITSPSTASVLRIGFSSPITSTVSPANESREQWSDVRLLGTSVARHFSCDLQRDSTEIASCHLCRPSIPETSAAFWSSAAISDAYPILLKKRRRTPHFMVMVSDQAATSQGDRNPALLHGPEQIADLPVPVAESPGAVRIGHPERSHLVEYLAPNSVFNSLPRQRSSPHLRPDDRLVTIDRVLHHASLGVA